MKNKFLKILLLILIYLNFSISFASEEFNFNVTEIQIKESGNKFIGTKKGKVTSNNGIIIEADTFIYLKSQNILTAQGNVIVTDTLNEDIIYSDKITYKKNEDIYFAEGNSKAVNFLNNLTIKAFSFKFDRIKNIIIAEKNVLIENKIEDYKIQSEFISYLRNEEKIYSKGKTLASVHSKYNFESSNIIFLKNEMELISNEDSTITDKSNLYNLAKFKYSINQEELKGEKILITSNYNLPESDKFFFSSAIIDLNSQNFIAKDTEVKVHKNIFNNPDNDPRIKGVSSQRINNITKINKGVFTSCKENDDCPPWAIEASEIEHDKNKKQINYKNALLKIYDFPVLYFPKFFHPDPTVKRQSGLLKPALNESNVLGTSFSIPYYHVISDESDLTFAPVVFDSDIKMVQNEYREVGQKYNLTANFGHTRNYKSSLLNKDKNITYLFSKLDVDLDLDNFNSSKMYLDLEKVTDDTFLKIFNTNIYENTTSLKPKNQTSLTSELKFDLNHENYNLTTGLQSFENLQVKNSDRYQFILPYYNFNMSLFPDFDNGSFNFNSNGSNDLNNTNQLKSRIINNVIYSSSDFISNNGIKNNFNFNLKNLNSVGKNVSDYKSSPQIELSSIFELKSSLPLKKETKNFNNFLTPKLSFRLNPSDMKNHTTTERTINTSNIFAIDRFGLEDSFETGKSLTIGVDYKKETINDMNKYFELKLASVLRDKNEDFIPSKTTLNKKYSNIFGSLTNNFSDNLKFDYNFAVDNDLDKIKYNDLGSTISINNFVTSFNYIKEMDEMGDQNYIENNTIYNFNDQNYLSFNTRRNKKINLTEYYNLVYEYKNDCLTAAIKYKKTYYEDRDLKPTEDLFFTVTLFPLTIYEQKIDR